MAHAATVSAVTIFLHSSYRAVIIADYDSLNIYLFVYLFNVQRHVSSTIKIDI